MKRTKRLALAHEVIAVVTKEAFKYLDAPPERLGAKMCTLPFNLGLEKRGCTAEG